MTRPSNPDRDIDIYEKRTSDRKKWSFDKLALHFNMAKSSIHKAFKRAKVSKDIIHLSTDNTQI